MIGSIYLRKTRFGKLILTKYLHAAVLLRAAAPAELRRALVRDSEFSKRLEADAGHFVGSIATFIVDDREIPAPA